MNAHTTVAGGSTLRGIALMVAATLVFAFLDSTAKWLGQSMTSIEVAWLRYATHVGVLCLAFRVWRDVSPFRTRHPWQQFFRGLTLVGSTVFNFWALQYLQLAQANAVLFAGPLLVTALAGPMLGETVGLRRWLAVMVGFAGVVVVLRPGMGEIHWAFGLAIVAMICGAFYSLLTRRMHRTETSRNMVMISALVGAVVLAPVAPAAVVAVDGPWHALLALSLGVYGAAGHYMLIIAHRMASASTLAPFGYAQMPLMILLGWLLFDQLPDRMTLLGIVIIAGSGLYVLHREQVHAREETARRRALRGPKP